MNLYGRWVPVEVMHTIFSLWGLIALLVFGATFWMYRTRAARRGRDKPLKSARKRHGRHKRRKQSS